MGSWMKAGYQKDQTMIRSLRLSSSSSSGEGEELENQLIISHTYVMKRL